jgi:hypothetical protein
MPLYTFENVKNKKVEDIYFNMSDAPKVGETYTDEKGVVWKRIFTLPNASISTKIDPFSKNDFLTATENKKGTMGDLFDKSQELSAARAAKSCGADPVREKFYKEWAKTRGGKVHPQKKRDDAIKKLKKKGIDIS